jgi:hypothetical protein
MEDILSTYYKCTLSAVIHKLFPDPCWHGHVPCCGMWNSCPKFVRTFKLINLPVLCVAPSTPSLRVRLHDPQFEKPWTKLIFFNSWLYACFNSSCACCLCGWGRTNGGSSGKGVMCDVSKPVGWMDWWSMGILGEPNPKTSAAGCNYVIHWGHSILQFPRVMKPQNIFRWKSSTRSRGRNYVYSYSYELYRDGSVGMVGRPGFYSRQDHEISTQQRPDRRWAPPRRLSIGHWGSLLENKAASAWRWPLTSILVPRSRMMELDPHFPICDYVIMLN